MHERPFRFLHTADLHLERPPHGLSEVPDHWRQRLLDAPYNAARRAIDAAIKERVDFVLIAGDLLDADNTGPRGPLFLLEQFQRLESANIAVYLVGGRVDSPQGPLTALRLPPNVRVLGGSEPETIVHDRDGVPLAAIVGWSRPRRRKLKPSDFHGNADGLFTIGLVYNGRASELPEGSGIDYWALGGLHERRSLDTGHGQAHWAGTPQGRCPEETGPHGCTLVNIDPRDRPRLALVPTDVVRFERSRVTVEPGMSASDLQRSMLLRQQELLKEAGGVDLLIEWRIVGSGNLLASLRRGKFAAELLDRLRLESGTLHPGAWSTSLIVEPQEVLPKALYEQDTLLGDYLRTLRRCEPLPQKKQDDPLQLADLLGVHGEEELLAAAARLDNLEIRRRVLQEAAALGVDLLSGEEQSS